MKLLKEGKTEFYADSKQTVSKDMEVFYNPVMKFNRDVTLWVLGSGWAKKNLKFPIRAGLPLAGSGVRGVRMLTELVPGTFDRMDMNDIDEVAFNTIKKNLEHNKIEIARVFQKDANDFLLSGCGYNYIDIDPFGSPNPFLDSAAKRISRGGILAVTATDTAGLCGTYPKVGLRKYWGKTLRNEHMHETGLRMLIRKVQEIGTQYDKALIAVLSYFRDHYFRIFFLCRKSRTECDKLAKDWGYLIYCPRCGLHETVKDIFSEKLCACGGKRDWAGTVYLGKIQEKELLEEMKDRFLVKIASELEIPFFYDIHRICKINKIAQLPKFERLIESIRKKGFDASLTHISPSGLKTDMELKELVETIKELIR